MGRECHLAFYALFCRCLLLPLLLSFFDNLDHVVSLNIFELFSIVENSAAKTILVEGVHILVEALSHCHDVSLLDCHHKRGDAAVGDRIDLKIKGVVLGQNARHSLCVTRSGGEMQSSPADVVFLLEILAKIQNFIHAACIVKVIPLWSTGRLTS